MRAQWVGLPARAGRGRFTLFGLDVIRAAAVTPILVGARSSGPDARGDDVFAGDALFLSRAALAATGARIGERVVVTANRRAVPLLVAGTLPGALDGQASAPSTSPRRSGSSDGWDGSTGST